MPDPTAVPPAMSAAEWDDVLRKREGNTGTPDPWLHRMAALALYGQPYGFTREDVALLHRQADDSSPAEARLCLSLAARLAALLPPHDAERPTPG